MWLSNWTCGLKKIWCLNIMFFHIVGPGCLNWLCSCRKWDSSSKTMYACVYKYIILFFSPRAFTGNLLHLVTTPVDKVPPCTSYRVYHIIYICKYVFIYDGVSAYLYDSLSIYIHVAMSHLREDFGESESKGTP